MLINYPRSFGLEKSNPVDSTQRRHTAGEMPKELRPTTCRRASQGGIGSVQQSPTGLAQNAPRNTAIWSGADDQTLISARASGLNWQPIAARHFPNKTANACRKRHERLMERRHHDEWDSRKLNALAIEYMECRKEMWNVLAVRIGERWGVVEAKVGPL